MANTRKTRRTGGAHRKAPEGLKKALFIRVDEALLAKLDELREKQSSEKPGIVLSRADIARGILWEAIQREETEK